MLLLLHNCLTFTKSTFSDIIENINWWNVLCLTITYTACSLVVDLIIVCFNRSSHCRVDVFVWWPLHHAIATKNLKDRTDLSFSAIRLAALWEKSYCFFVFTEPLCGLHSCLLSKLFIAASRGIHWSNDTVILFARF